MRALLHRSQYLFSIVGVLLLIGCTSPAPTYTPTATTEPSPIPDTLQSTATPTSPPTATHTPESPPTMTATSSPIATPTSYPSPTPGLPLSAEGPWFIFEARLNYRGADDLWIMNLDGTGLSQLPITGMNRYDLHPTESIIAYVAGDMFNDPTLTLLYLPSGETETITPLTLGTTVFQLTPPADPTEEKNQWLVARAINDNWPSWSRDGRSLAFVGAMNGTSSDVYVYSLDTGEITQVTSGPTQVQYLMWSPDDRHILHLGIDSFGTGAGDNANAIWVARSDGSGSIRLASLPNGQSQDASLFGWMSNDLVLVSDYSAGAGYNNLRLIDITTGAVETIWEYFFTSVAVDRESGTMLIAPLEVYNLEVERGLWLYRPGFPLQQVTETGYARWLFEIDSYVSWLSASGVFYVKMQADQGEGALVIDPDGNSTFVLVGMNFRHIMEAPGGQLWVWYGPDGLYIGAPSQTPECVFDEEVGWIRWLPDGTGMFVATEDTIYYTPYPNIDFQPIVSDLYIGNSGRFIP